jgi:hypothetical protein
MTGAWSARVSQIFHVSSESVDGDYHPELLLYPNLKSSMEGRLSDRLLWNATISEVHAVAQPRNIIKEEVNKNARVGCEGYAKANS